MGGDQTVQLCLVGCIVPAIPHINFIHTHTSQDFGVSGYKTALMRGTAQQEQPALLLIE